MRRITEPSRDRMCQRCGEQIPTLKRSDAAYCSVSCRSSAEKARYCARNPEYVTRQRRLVKECYHLKTHGHTDFIDHPVGNPKDKFRQARALGFRSMLEVQVAEQLKEAGVSFEYEKTSINYVKEDIDAS